MFIYTLGVPGLGNTTGARNDHERAMERQTREIPCPTCGVGQGETCIQTWPVLDGQGIGNVYRYDRYNQLRSDRSHWRRCVDRHGPGFWKKYIGYTGDAPDLVDGMLRG